eukprot:TRINITY_DN22830_c0_g1_i1.p1 TRINITY_DN22830_c0_g1~~TRINITY_DN22830_c0_g1_i1.p1  ORF type:complete len:435 (+),score=123.19 TRINITY_DN22830_c0_g1_i1:47-1306(+)
MTSWVSYEPECEFPIQNLPYGVFDGKNGRRCGVAIGDKVVDLKELSNKGFFSKAVGEAFQETKLNTFMGLGKEAWAPTRQVLTKLLSSSEGALRDDMTLREKAIYDIDEVRMVMPCKVGDYTDFYSSREHATNLGKLFRPNGNALLPNWLHLPVGYHGRASSIVVSGTPIRRPNGQVRPDDAQPPKHATSSLLDMELEMGAFVGKANELGTPITMATVKDHVFGMCLFNDWSARDLQKWEYVPLGPFLGKNFGSTVSPWIVTMEALEPFVCDGPPQGQNDDPVPLPYLQQNFPGALDINLSATLKPKGKDSEVTLTNTNFKYMYWSVFQQLVHHTINGCNVNPGDLFASGTISGPEPGSYGSMLEITWRGSKPIDIGGGESRKFFQNGDSCRLHGHCQGDGYRVGFGQCEGTILPAPEL